MTRRTDWQARLQTFLVSHRTDVFAYGRWDCCLFVCDAIVAMTGEDPAAQFRGAYSSRAEARRLLVAHGGTASVQAVVESVTAKSGMPETPILHARRGDVALIPRTRGYSLALVSLNGRDVVLASSLGLWTLPLSSAVRAWHV